VGELRRKLLAPWRRLIDVLEGDFEADYVAHVTVRGHDGEVRVVRALGGAELSTAIAGAALRGASIAEDDLIQVEIREAT
jgi:hypothetical protein